MAKKKAKKNDIKPVLPGKKKKKRSRFKERLPLIFIFLFLMVGVGIFMYPIIGNWYTEYNSMMEISNYDTIVQNTSRDVLERLEREAVEYNKALASGDKDKLSVTNYDELLALSSSIGYIEIPKIGVYLPIYKGLDDVVLDKAVGHMEGTSLPVGGESTHAVLAGHTGLPSAKLFTDLDIMEKGDAFYIHVLDKVLKYEIDQIKVVLPEDKRDIEIVEGQDYVTLLTCTPYGINSHRLLVRGKRMPYETQTMATTYPWPVVHASEEKIPFRTLVWYGAAAVITFIVLVILIILLFPSMQNIKKRRAARRARKAERAFEALIAEESRQLEAAKQAERDKQAEEKSESVDSENDSESSDSEKDNENELINNAEEADKG